MKSCLAVQKGGEKGASVEEELCWGGNIYDKQLGWSAGFAQTAL
jgi:hypothetical protein